MEVAPAVEQPVVTVAPAVEAPEVIAEQPPEEAKPARVYSQEEVDAITKKVRDNTRHRTKRETEAYLRGLRESQPQQQKAPEPKPVEAAPTREQFGSYEEFLEAKAVHAASKAAKDETAKALREKTERETQQKADAERSAQLKSWNEKVDSARGEYDDFEDVTANSDVVCTPAMSQAIVESEHGGRLAYFLAKNPEEAARISKLSPTKQIAAIVSLEEKVTRPAKAPSKAPPPINPAGKVADASTAIDTTNPKAAETLSTAEWIRLDRERVAREGKRY